MSLSFDRACLSVQGSAYKETQGNYCDAVKFSDTIRDAFNETELMKFQIELLV